MGIQVIFVYSFFFFFLFFFFALQYCIGFAIHQHESAMGSCSRVPHPEPLSHLPPRTIPPGHPSAPAPSILYRTWTGDSFLI